MNNLETTVIIAGNSESYCSEISSIIQHERPDAMVSDIVYSGSALLEKISEKKPDIVICDAALQGISCFEVMQRASVGSRSSTGSGLSSFILYGTRDFDAVYRALKFGAIDYLLLPILPDSLCLAIDKVSSLTSFTMADSASRLFYVDDKGMDSLKKQRFSPAQVNKMYGTNFSEGLYTMIFVKYDSAHTFRVLSMSSQSILMTDEQIRHTFDDICFDIICTKKSDGVMAVLNYSSEMQILFDKRIQELYMKICRLAKESSDTDVTLCVSQPVTNPCDVWAIKEQVRDTEWSRMVLGVNKILYWKENSISADFDTVDKLNLILKRVRAAIESLNEELFISAISDFYKLPEHVLLSREARMLFRQIVYVIVEMYWDEIAKFTDPTGAYEMIAYCSHLCTDFRGHREIFISRYVELIRAISVQVEKKFSLPVSNAISYINNNLSNSLSLKTVSDYVRLSPTYFSSLFKKETGTNFSSFVITQRNDYACRLLKKTDLSVSEIAFKVGFQDVRAFSKQFRSVNDMTPSRYRKLHAEETLR